MNDDTLSADYFDGERAQAIPIELDIRDGKVHLSGPGLDLQVPVNAVRWPERTRHGARIAQLPAGAAVHARASADWDQWVRRHGIQEGWVVHIQQSWRLVAASTMVLVALCIAGYLWGLPLAGRAIIAATPTSVDHRVGELAMSAVQDQWLRPSKIPKAEQQRLRALFLRAQEQHHLAQESGMDALPIKVHFYRSRIGPNAFALPDGSIVFTDELVTLLKGHDDALIGVFGHELGHVRHRHTMRQLVQSGLLAAATSVALGDFSQWLAAAPALLGHMGYSRDFEREADQASIDLMQANGIRPSVMVTFFEEIDAYRKRPQRADDSDKREKRRQNEPSSEEDDDGHAHDGDKLGIAFSSHPADAERIARFKDADRR